LVVERHGDDVTDFHVGSNGEIFRMNRAGGFQLAADALGACGVDDEKTFAVRGEVERRFAAETVGPTPGDLGNHRRFVVVVHVHCGMNELAGLAGHFGLEPVPAVKTAPRNNASVFMRGGSWRV